MAASVSARCYTVAILEIRADEANPIVDFLTEVTPEIRPGEWFTKKKLGTYLLDIAVGANNAKVVHKTLRITFVGGFDDEAQMFSRRLVVQIATQR